MAPNAIEAFYGRLCDKLHAPIIEFRVGLGLLVTYTRSCQISFSLNRTNAHALRSVSGSASLRRQFASNLIDIVLIRVPPSRPIYRTVYTVQPTVL